MSVFLLILKILGIIVLAIISLIVLLLLCLIIVPFRYIAKANTNNKRLEGYINISWLFKAISIKVNTSNLNTNISFKVFGFNIDRKNKKIKEDKKNGKQINNSNLIENNLDEEKVNKAKQNTKKSSLKEAIKTIINIPKNIKHSADNLEYKTRRICDIISERRKVFKSKRFRKAYIRLKKNCIKVLNIIKPKRFRGSIIVGFEDKMYTGLIVAFCSMLYPYFENNLRLTTVSDKIIKIDLKAKGRFRILRLYKPIKNIYKDKEIKALINEIRI